MNPNKNLNKRSSFKIMYQHVSNFSDIPLTNLKQLYEKFDPVFCTRGNYIVKEGHLANYLYFLVHGVTRTFFVKENKEHVLELSTEPSFCFISSSFRKEKPSKFSIQAISDCEILQVSKQTLEGQMRSETEIARLIGHIFSRHNSDLLQRHCELMSLPMKERFKQFTKRKAHLLHRVPQKHIASYLNMDPTNFSKLINSRRIGE